MRQKLLAMSLPINELRDRYGATLRENEPLARYTSARVGGVAELLLIAESSGQLEEIARFLWERELPYRLLGGGSNVLVSDDGIRGVVVLNRARQIHFELDSDPPTVWVESGVNIGSLARQACQRGLGRLEWAIGVPGTVGGAVVGNAGAHDGDMAGNLVVAEILHRKEAPGYAPDEWIVKELWTPDRLAFGYRASALKQLANRSVVLAARLGLSHTSPQAALAKAERFTAYRRRTQPPGATMGSMFKNPTGDYAGRLIEAAGLKGARIGDAEISHLHANFFVNLGKSTASDIYALINLVQQEVSKRFGVELELEIELFGDWQLERARK
jgi:UDP-N-acetylmuramate dehydrogenase